MKNTTHVMVWPLEATDPLVDGLQENLILIVSVHGVVWLMHLYPDLNLHLLIPSHTPYPWGSTRGGDNSAQYPVRLEVVDVLCVRVCQVPRVCESGFRGQQGLGFILQGLRVRVFRVHVGEYNGLPSCRHLREDEVTVVVGHVG